MSWKMSADELVSGYANWNNIIMCIIELCYFNVNKLTEKFLIYYSK